MVTFINTVNAIWQLAVEVHVSLASSARPLHLDSFQSSADQLIAWTAFWDRAHRQTE